MTFAILVQIYALNAPFIFVGGGGGVLIRNVIRMMYWALSNLQKHVVYHPSRSLTTTAVTLHTAITFYELVVRKVLLVTLYKKQTFLAAKIENKMPIKLNRMLNCLSLVPVL